MDSSMLLHLIENLQGAHRHPALSACTDHRTVGDHIGLESLLPHLIEELQGPTPCTDHCSEGDQLGRNPCSRNTRRAARSTLYTDHCCVGGHLGLESLLLQHIEEVQGHYCQPIITTLMQHAASRSKMHKGRKARAATQAMGCQGWTMMATSATRDLVSSTRRIPVAT